MNVFTGKDSKLLITKTLILMILYIKISTGLEFYNDAFERWADNLS